MNREDFISSTTVVIPYKNIYNFYETCRMFSD